ncbi:type VI secretion system tip protein TssI/VgrG [Chondromyces apiculatus]|uniref:VgrG protein n=1 Tax=Chondromyces apiculatus DSM 436 TaxID=1192034 RepID=A0A017SVJ8_9BACT|nr:type VI secretion system tip protein TssI/VgrG [Chondromyces apiculatus]EYF00610.1 VgrG protein [Chondromyces apiculatus DSM 436]
MTRDPFELQTGLFSPAQLRIVSLRGREVLSDLFSFRLEVHVAPDLDGRDAELLGTHAILILRDPRGIERRIEVLVDQVRASATFTPRTGPTWHLRLVPPLALLRRQTTSRIFQDQTVPQILQHILQEASIPAELRLARTYAVRNYCVQYRETTYAFVRRLAAEEGIAFCFADALAGSGDREGSAASAPVIFLDAPAHYPTVGGGDAPAALPLRPEEGLTPSGNEILSFGLQRALKPTSVHLTDHDFRRPNLNLSARVGDASSSKPPLGVYQHHADFDAPDITPARAQTYLEQVQRRATAGRGESWVRALAPGRSFELRTEASHSIDGTYAVTRVIHEGHTPELSGRPQERTYRNSFTCVPATTLLRPRAPARQPRQVMETAVVTGPEAHEVHTDEHARIKVQFHWDLDGRHDENTSAWLRVAQSWAGASFGSQHIPRVGMEVLVGFLGGDTDCPVVLGCLYNATHPPPFPLPAEKAKSGLRTQSTPGAGGANELSFDDRAGEERVFLFAERDLDEVVQHDHALMIGHDQQISVQGDRAVVVRHDQTTSVQGNRTGSTAGTSIERVGENRLVTVKGSQHLAVEGDASSVVGKDLDLAVKGRLGATVGTDAEEAVATLDVHGDGAVATTGSVRVKATRSLRLSCGDSVIELTPDEIRLDAKAITILGGGSVSLLGKGPALHLTDKALIDAKAITLKTPQAFLKLEEDASLQGKLVKLNCDTVDDWEEPEEKPEPPKAFRVRVADVYEKPYARKKYHLRVDGVLHEGQTTDDGMVEQDLPPTADTGELVVWIKEPDQEPTLRWRLKLGDLPPMDTPHGIRLRLKNLGYYRITEGQTEGAYADAIKAFQRDQGLDPTGVLDDETKARIASAHGH